MEDFATEISLLAYRARRRKVIERARSEGGALFFRSAASSADFDLRCAALQAAYVTRDDIIALSLVRDDSAWIRWRAIACVARICSDEQIMDMVRRLSLSFQRRLMINVARAHRRSLSEGMVTHMEAAGDVQAVRDVFMLCGGQYVQQTMLKHSSCLSHRQWAKLARRHPDIAAGFTLKAIQSMTAPDPRVPDQMKAILIYLHARHSQQIFAMLVALRKAFPLKSLPFREVVARFPSVAADLLIHWREWIECDLTVNKVTADKLCSLLQIHPALADRIDWHSLRRVLPQMLTQLKQANFFIYRSIPLALIRALPKDVRFVEALAAVNSETTSASNRLAFLGCCDPSFAFSRLQRIFEGDSKVTKTDALKAMVECSLQQPARHLAVIALMKDRINESETVVVFLQAVAELHPKTWTLSEVDAMVSLLDQLLASENAESSLPAVFNLALRMYSCHAERLFTTMRQLTILSQRSEWPDLSSVKLSAETCETLMCLLVDQLTNSTQREQDFEVSKLLRALGRHMAKVPESVRQLFSRVETEGNDWPVMDTLRDLHRAAPDLFREVSASLLQRDATLLKDRKICLSYERTSLTAYDNWLQSNCRAKGLLNEQGHFFVPFLPRHRKRCFLSATYQERFEKIARQQSREGLVHDEVCRYLGSCQSLLPPSCLLAEMAFDTSLTDNARMSARLALSQHDNIKCLRFLLYSFSKKEDYRDVVYSAQGRMRYLDRDEALELINKIDCTMISTHKMVCRMLGELRIKEPLITAFNSEATHRDVKAAIITALSTWRDEDCIWKLLFESLDNLDWRVAEQIAKIQVDGVSPTGCEQLVEILVRLLSYPSRQLRRSVCYQLGQRPIPDPKCKLLWAVVKMAQEYSTELALSEAATALVEMSATPTTTDAEMESLVTVLSRNKRLYEILVMQASDKACSGECDRLLLSSLKQLENDELTDCPSWEGCRRRLVCRVISYLDSPPLFLQRARLFFAQHDDTRRLFLAQALRALTDRFYKSASIERFNELLAVPTDQVSHFLAALTARVHSGCQGDDSDNGQRLRNMVLILRDSTYPFAKVLSAHVPTKRDRSYSYQSSWHCGWRRRSLGGNVDNLPKIEDRLHNDIDGSLSEPEEVGEKSSKTVARVKASLTLEEALLQYRSAEALSERCAAVRVIAAEADEESLRGVFRSLGYRMAKYLCVCLCRRDRRSMVARLICTSEWKLELLSHSDTDFIRLTLLTDRDDDICGNLLFSKLTKKHFDIAYMYLMNLVKLRGVRDECCVMKAKLLMEGSDRRHRRELEEVCKVFVPYYWSFFVSTSASPARPRPSLDLLSLSGLTPEDLFSESAQRKHCDLYMALQWANSHRLNTAVVKYEEVSVISAQNFARYYGSRIHDWSRYWNNTPQLRQRYAEHLPRLLIELRDSDGMIDDRHMPKLPRAVRLDEIRRMIALPAMADKGSEIADYAAYLPFDEAMEILSPLLSDPKDDARISAHTAFGCLCLREPVRLTDMLTMQAERCRREKSPVRFQCLTAIAKQPDKNFSDSHLPQLCQIMDNAFAMHDLCENCYYQIDEIAFKLAPRWPMEAAKWMRLSRGPRLPCQKLNDKRLTTTNLQVIASALMERVNEDALLWQRILRSIVTALGHRLKELPDFVTQMCRFLSSVATPHNCGRVEEVAAYIFKYDKVSFLSEAESLLKTDLSWLSLSVFAKASVRDFPQVISKWAAAKGSPKGQLNPNGFFFCPQIPFKVLRHLPRKQQRDWNKVVSTLIQTSTSTSDIQESGLSSTALTAIITSAAHLDGLSIEDSLLCDALKGDLKAADLDGTRVRNFAAHQIIRGGRLSALDVLKKVGSDEEKKQWLMQAERYRLRISEGDGRQEEDAVSLYDSLTDIPEGKRRSHLRTLRRRVNEPEVQKVIERYIAKLTGDSSSLSGLLSLTVKGNLIWSESAERTLAKILRLALQCDETETRQRALKMMSSFTRVSFTGDVLQLVHRLDSQPDTTEGTTSGADKATLGGGEESGDAGASDKDEDEDKEVPLCIRCLGRSCVLECTSSDDMKSVIDLLRTRPLQLDAFRRAFLETTAHPLRLGRVDSLLLTAVERLGSDLTHLESQLSYIFAISDDDLIVTALRDLLSRFAEQDDALDIYYALLADILIGLRCHGLLVSSSVIPKLIKEGSTPFTFAALRIFMHLDDRDLWHETILVWSQRDQTYIKHFLQAEPWIAAIASIYKLPN